MRLLGLRLAAVAAFVAVAAALAAILDPDRTPARTAPAPRTVTRSEGVTRRAHRGATISGAAARRATVPILMYHVIAAAPRSAPFPQLWVPPSRFRSQVRGLARRGFTGVTLSEVLAAWRHGSRLPRRPVVLSFDDGYASDATRAAPVLQRLRWPADLDLAIRNTGAGGISLSELHRLVRDGWEIDSHTVTHPDLTTLAPRALRAELVDSKAWIRRRLGVAAPFFCYPAGR